MKKEILTRKIYKYNVPLDQLKYSHLYLLSIEKKSDKGNIIERYIKFGKTIDAVKRFKSFEKDYADYEIGYIWLSFDKGLRWLDIETYYIEKFLKKSLDCAFEKYSAISDKKIYGYTEIYNADSTTDDEFIFYLETELQKILRARTRNVNELQQWGKELYAN